LKAEKFFVAGSTPDARDLLKAEKFFVAGSTAPGELPAPPEIHCSFAI
jgi:hypothetical protein